MSNILAVISENIFRMAKQSVYAHGFTKENLQQLITSNLDMHNNVVYGLESTTDREFNDICNREALPNLKKVCPKVLEAYQQYGRMLDSANRSKETKRILGSLISANRDYVNILTMLSSRVDEIMTHEKVTIADTRLSTVAILGILQHSTWVGKFSLYMYTYIVKGAAHMAGAVPKYREAFLQAHARDVGQIVVKLSKRQGDYTFLDEIKHLRENAQDNVLGPDGTFGIAANNLTPSILDYLASALSCLNIFGAALDMWDDYCLWRNDCNKETKAWLEKHNALLRMKLDQMDPSSPEYAELQNIIKVYDQNITEYEEKITKFEEGR